MNSLEPSFTCPVQQRRAGCAVEALVTETVQLNDLLRALEAEKEELTQQHRAVYAELQAVRQKCMQTRADLAHVRTANTALAQELRRAEEQFTSMVRLCSAATRFDSVAERSQVLRTIAEVASDMLGSEQLAIFACCHAPAPPEVLYTRGIEAEQAAAAIASPRIHECLLRGDLYAAPAGQALTACIPLRIQERTVGAIAIFGLLPQKLRLDQCDYRMFDLLSRHGAAALCRTLGV